MMNKIIGTVFAVVLLCTSCFLRGERPAETRMIALSFPEADGQIKGNLSPNNPEVQEALRLIDALLVSEGFGPNTNRMGGDAHGFIAGYAKYSADGLRRVTGPDVYLENGRLKVVFTELGNRSGHFSAATQKIFGSLQKELTNRFGTSRVSIVKPPGG